LMYTSRIALALESESMGQTLLVKERKEKTLTQVTLEEVEKKVGVQALG
jgi:hypothetical protein